MLSQQGQHTQYKRRYSPVFTEPWDERLSMLSLRGQYTQYNRRFSPVFEEPWDEWLRMLRRLWEGQKTAGSEDSRGNTPGVCCACVAAERNEALLIVGREGPSGLMRL